MGVEEIPPALLKAHPELRAIEEALQDYENGRPITARCPGCGEPLKVVEVEATGALWVGCDTGDTSMRISRRRPATS